MDTRASFAFMGADFISWLCLIGFIRDACGSRVHLRSAGSSYTISSTTFPFWCKIVDVATISGSASWFLTLSQRSVGPGVTL